MNNTVLEMG